MEKDSGLFVLTPRYWLILFLLLFVCSDVELHFFSYLRLRFDDGLGCWAMFGWRIHLMNTARVESHGWKIAASCFFFFLSLMHYSFLVVSLDLLG